MFSMALLFGFDVKSCWDGGDAVEFISETIHLKEMCKFCTEIVLPVEKFSKLVNPYSLLIMFLPFKIHFSIYEFNTKKKLVALPET